MEDGDCHLPKGKARQHQLLEPVPHKLKLRFTTNFTKSLQAKAPSCAGLLSLDFGDPEAVDVFIPKPLLSRCKSENLRFVHDLQLFLSPNRASC